jgi:hypothetical protein
MENGKENEGLALLNATYMIAGDTLLSHETRILRLKS